MKSFWFVFCFGLIFNAMAQKSKVIRWPEMETMLADPADSLTVINFWATWCKPCVAELPHFEEARKAFAGKPVRFWLISLDFEEFKKSKLDPFIEKRGIQSKVFLLDETDYDKWIGRLEPGWSGAIPATLVVNNSKKIRKFVNSELSAEQLNQLINSNL